MLTFPPKPTAILPHESHIENYIIQPKWRGWRIAIHNNKSWTRKGVSIPVETNFPEKDYDYQLDGEIISIDKEVEHQVRTAIKNGRYQIRIFDIWVPSKPDMTIEERLELLKSDFGIEVETYSAKTGKEVEYPGQIDYESQEIGRMNPEGDVDIDAEFEIIDSLEDVKKLIND